MSNFVNNPTYQELTHLFQKMAALLSGGGNGDDTATAITVSGPVTDTQLRATPIDVKSIPRGALVSTAIKTGNGDAVTLTAGQRVVLQNCLTNAVAHHCATGATWGTIFTGILYGDTAQDAGNGGKEEFIASGAMVISLASNIGVHRVSVTVFAS